MQGIETEDANVKAAEDETTQRVSVPALDAILGHQFPVLDKGFVRVVDYMGGDASVVRAARVSYGKGTKSVREDRGLIRYLMRHEHATPFEHATLALHLKVPMDAWRQMVRHRLLSVNEYSTRYSEAIDDKQETAADAWRLQSTKNKQGSAGLVSSKAEADKVSPGEHLSNRERQLHDLAVEVYQERLALGVAREQARKDLPLSTYTEVYLECCLRGWLHFLGLRMDSHAQLEIRTYANIIGKVIVAAWCPLTWEAFCDYRLNARTFSAQEMQILLDGIGRAGAGFNVDTLPINVDTLSKRERLEFLAKLKP